MWIWMLLYIFSYFLFLEAKDQSVVDIALSFAMPHTAVAEELLYTAWMDADDVFVLCYFWRNQRESTKQRHIIHIKPLKGEYSSNSPKIKK